MDISEYSKDDPLDLKVSEIEFILCYLENLKIRKKLNIENAKPPLIKCERKLTCPVYGSDNFTKNTKSKSNTREDQFVNLVERHGL